MTEMLSVTFTLEACAEPGMLPRLLQPFAKRDLTPDRLHSERQDDVLRVEAALDAVDPQCAALIHGNLSQVVGVLRLAMAQQRPCLAEAA